MTRNTGEKTFIRITNQNIYDKLVEVEKHVVKTNGQVRVNKWMARTSFVLIIALLGWFINHISIQ